MPATPTTIFSQEDLRRLTQTIIDLDWDIAHDPDNWEMRPFADVQILVEFAARKAVLHLVDGGLGYSSDFLSRQIEKYPQCCYHGWGRCKKPPLSHTLYCAEHQAEMDAEQPTEDWSI